MSYTVSRPDLTKSKLPSDVPLAHFYPAQAAAQSQQAQSQATHQVRTSRSMVNPAHPQIPAPSYFEVAPFVFETSPLPTPVGSGPGSTMPGTPTPLPASLRPLPRRRQSMPSIKATPPAYTPSNTHQSPSRPSFLSRLSTSFPGTEPLPPYSNAIFLVATLPRKVEFTAPGVVSRDRKWRRVTCILEGTKFAVHRPRRESVGAKLWDAWEGVVGAADVEGTGEGVVEGTAEAAIRRNRRERERETREWEGVMRKCEEEMRLRREGVRALQRDVEEGEQREEEGAGESVMVSVSASNFSLMRASESAESTSSQSQTHSRTRSQTFGSASQASATTSASSIRSHSSQRSSLSEASSHSHPHSSSSTPTSPHLSSFAGPLPAAADLIREYTLQHAESGLAVDYKKRKNVIRVRMEGEQFLIQARDTDEVVEWIEVNFFLFLGSQISTFLSF